MTRRTRESLRRVVAQGRLVNVLEALVNVITGAPGANGSCITVHELNTIEVKGDAAIVGRKWIFKRMESRKEYGLAATRTRLVRR
jgi:hypothetical protein